MHGSLSFSCSLRPTRNARHLIGPRLVRVFDSLDLDLQSRGSDEKGIPPLTVTHDARRPAALPETPRPFESD